MKSKLFMTFLGLFIAFSVQALDLSPAPLCDGNPKTKDQAALDAGKVIGNVYSESSISATGCIGWTNLGSGDVWYDLTKDIAINAVNIITSSFLNNWPLTPSNTCASDDIDCSEPWWVGRWGDQEFLEPEITQRIINYDQNIAGLYKFQLSYGEQEIDEEVGCLEAHPLRYGDVDGDGRNELVLFLKDTLVFFSPDIGKVTFATLYNYSDYIPWQTLQNDTSMHLGSPNNETPQYASKAAYQQDNNGIDALRSYGKLYIQDFDGDKVADIVVWRKLYRSKLQGDTTPGFDKVRDTLLFYKKINGTYALQSDTAPEVIQSWLSTAKLTWSKGFPSLSECPGEEGKPIPEMHDPLLNDPDVLQ
jgi:hypothetical protein